MTPFGRLHVTWLDLWTHSYGLEIVLDHHVLLDVGFGAVRATRRRP
jgi:hypothetical protein